jgi:hypothetical protein
MAPNGVVDAPAVYSVMKYPPVIELIRSKGSAIRDIVNEMIDNLQFDPRPPGHAPMFRDSPILKLLVEDTTPKYLLVYTVNDELARVEVIALQEHVPGARR